MTLFQAFGQFAGQAAVTEYDFALITPASISYSGTSASIIGDGEVTFTTVTSVSVNDVFSSTYEHYLVLIDGQAGSSGPSLSMRYRVGGSDETGSYNTYQELTANGSSVSGTRATSQDKMIIGGLHADAAQGMNVMFFSPNVAKQKVVRSYNSHGFSNSYFRDAIGTHTQTTQYTGFTIYVSSTNITGSLRVYGVRS